MFDLSEMRAAADARLSMAQLEADVLEEIAEFGSWIVQCRHSCGGIRP